METTSRARRASPLDARGASVLDALGDPQTRQILLELDAEAQEVHSLVLHTGLPQSSVYRKLKELESVGLVRIARFAFTPEGRKVEVYASALRQVKVDLGGGRIRLEIVASDDAADRLGRIWEQVRSRGATA